MEAKESTPKQIPLNDITNQAKENTLLADKFVLKRKGDSQRISVDKIRVRLENLLDGLAHKYINLELIINKTVSYA